MKGETVCLRLFACCVEAKLIENLKNSRYMWLSIIFPQEYTLPHRLTKYTINRLDF